MFDFDALEEAEEQQVAKEAVRGASPAAATPAHPGAASPLACPPAGTCGLFRRHQPEPTSPPVLSPRALSSRAVAKPAPPALASTQPPALSRGTQQAPGGDKSPRGASRSSSALRSRTPSGVSSTPRSTPSGVSTTPRSSTGSRRSTATSSAGSSRSTAASSSAAKASDKATSSSAPVCDKCDGKHRTESCPHFKSGRDDHKDAWVNYGKKGNPLAMGSSGGDFVLRKARVVRQPGDGSCLFHSLNHGLEAKSSSSASTLRREIVRFLEQNPDMEIAGDTIEEWVQWDAQTSVPRYARKMEVGGWGGGIEMAACSKLKQVNVHVYESAGASAFRRISCFDHPGAKSTVHVLYQGRMHYDALVPL